MSSTTRELQRIRQEREELEAKRAQTKRAFHAALRPNPTAGGPIRSTQTLTVPEEFSFHTDARLRSAQQPEPAPKAGDGPSAKDGSSSAAAKQDKGTALTAPEPFQFRVRGAGAVPSHTHKLLCCTYAPTISPPPPTLADGGSGHLTPARAP